MKKLSASINLAFNARRNPLIEKSLSLALLAACVLAAVSGARGQSNYEPYSFSTFAGVAGSPGGGDGVRNFARFNKPTGVAIDRAANIYIADEFNNTIRKISRSGWVSTFAGKTGTDGSADGVGNAARFKFPQDVAVDDSGNIYVADTSNHTIRRITPAGVVTTFAGSPGVSGSEDGVGSSARFDNPTGLAIDSDGNIYVADNVNHTIRKITPGGAVSTIAGMAGSHGSEDGPGNMARFFYPKDLGVDDSGNIYVADQANSTIRKITPGGVVSTLAGLAGSTGSTDGTGSAARFNNPKGLIVDGVGNLYVADGENHTIRRVTGAGVVITLAGVAGSPGAVDGNGDAAHFNGPSGMALNNGVIFVADSVNNMIRTVTTSAVVKTLAGSARNPGGDDGTTGSAGLFRAPRGIASDNAGNIYLADEENHNIRKISPDGAASTLAGLAGISGSADGTGIDARFNRPFALTVNSGGIVYVADFNNHTIRKILPNGVVSTLAGSPGNPGANDGTGSAARFFKPAGLALDNAGNIYVADTSNTIRKVTPNGVVTTIAGSPGTTGSDDGVGAAARFSLPTGLAVDGANNIYVADAANATIRKITPSGLVSTLAGLAGNLGNADGVGGAARFFTPVGLTFDGVGSLYVSQHQGQNIRAVTLAGAVTTVAGVYEQAGFADGTGSAARFSFPESVVASVGGSVYIADNGNSIIRKMTPSGMVTTFAGIPGMTGSGDGDGMVARLHSPNGVAVDRTGTVYVADYENKTVRKITTAGIVSTFAGSTGTGGSADGTGGAALFQGPAGIAVDNARNLYVADSVNHAIRKVTPSGVVTTLAGQAGMPGSIDGAGNAARFNYPSGVAVDRNGNIYVADNANHTIRKITAGGVVTTWAGLAGNPGGIDGTRAGARFNFPNGVAVDGAGDVYVADSGNHTIRKITFGGVSTVAGSAASPGSADGVGGFTRFNVPRGLVVDGGGNIYVADSNNNTIRKITPDRVVTTLGGSVGNTGSEDGAGNAARFNDPTDIAVDAVGKLYVADQNNQTIRLGTPPIPLAGAHSTEPLGDPSSDIDLVPGAEEIQGIECRTNPASPGQYRVVMTFATSSSLAVTNASVIPDPNAVPAATGDVNSASANDSEVTVDLVNVSNAQTLFVSLGVTDGTYSTSVSIPMSVLIGDTSGDGAVNSADISLTKSKSGQSVNATNFREDLNVDGFINSADISLVKSKSGTGLP